MTLRSTHAALEAHGHAVVAKMGLCRLPMTDSTVYAVLFRAQSTCRSPPHFDRQPTVGTCRAKSRWHGKSLKSGVRPGLSPRGRFDSWQAPGNSGAAKDKCISVSTYDTKLYHNRHYLDITRLIARPESNVYCEVCNLRHRYFAISVAISLAIDVVQRAHFACSTD